ncbi:MAG: BspA family leucine-rich repeat surface protein [Lachnospiraceae bacterium]|nr:BspA family leucine-rich repeat surface protein [Lachnospiraceae bacterium]
MSIKRYRKWKRIIAYILTVTVIFSCITNMGMIMMTKAAQSLGIDRFVLNLKSGAEYEDGKYVWKPTDSIAGHEFVYSIEYGFRGEENIEAGAIRIVIPRHILKARNGYYADLCVLSVPELSAIQGVGQNAYNEFGYTVSGDSIVITNAREISSASSGYIDIAYETNRSTFEYPDGVPTDAPHISVTLSEQGSVVANEQADGAKVYIDTDAKLTSVEKKAPDYRIVSWNPAWGERPEDANQYYYLEWSVNSKIDATQPYSIKLEDIFSETDAEIVGYKLAGSSTYSSVNESGYSTLTGTRTDNILTRHLKSSYSMEQYTQENSVKVTVTPTDGEDVSSQNSASAVFKYDKPVFVVPTTGYNAWKYGNTTWSESPYEKAWDVSDYGLTDFVLGTRDSIEGNVKYYISTVTNKAYVHTLLPGADPSIMENYGKVDLTYTVTDDRFYFNDDITTNMEKITIPEGEEPLTWEDYEIEYITYRYLFKDAVLNSETMDFDTISPTLTDTDILSFYARFEDDTEWKMVATDNLYTGELWYDSNYVDSMVNRKIDFKENCTSYKIITSNHHYYTVIDTVPFCKVKRSDRILESINHNPFGSNRAWLTNLGDYKVTKEVNGEEKTLYHKEINGRDYFIGYLVNSSISKNKTSIYNDIVNKLVTIGWKVDVSESYTTNEGINYITQESGTFYDLLPMGSEVNLSTVSISTEAGILDESALDVSTIVNYHDTGRTMLVVKIKEQFKKASLTYEMIQPWESIIDYGETILNSVAFETGNDSIENGYPDNGGKISEYELMKDIDPDVTTEEKFLYAERSCKVSVLIAANSGLTKTVKNATDYNYSDHTSVRQNNLYMYKLRYNSIDRTETGNMIFFDSLENYVLNGENSDWHGRLQGIDTAQLRSLGIAPVIYYTDIENINIREHCDLEERTETDEKIWKVQEEFGDIENATGIAIDMRKDVNGNDFKLSGGESISVLLYMESPASDTTGKDNPKTYNDVYFYRTIKFLTNNSEMVIPDDEKLDYQAYTEVDFRIMADVRILKVSSADKETPVKGVTFSLVGVSDYGTNVNKTLMTDINGKINFSDIEKGTYVLTEIEGNEDYLPLESPIIVKIDNNGGITFDGVSVLEGVYFNIEDEQRLHSNISFYKRDIVYPALFITDARFSLTGTSKYGSEVMMYASSDENGVVTFPNIEYGTYIMRETNTDHTHILDGNVYIVNVMDNDMFSIAVSHTEGQGDDTLLYSGLNGAYSVYNEPYHSFTIQKEAYGTGEAIAGVVFELKGETDSGTNIDTFKTTNSRGQITYENMESGVYTIQEISAPYGFGVDSTIRSVTIDKRGAVTIDGITKNDNGNFVFINKQNGAVTITKKWVDNENNESREQKGITAKIYLSTEKSNVSSAKFGNGLTNSTSVLTKVTAAGNIKAFKQYTGDDANVQDLIDEGIAIAIDDGDTALERIYGWCFTDAENEYYIAHSDLYELNTLYWWSPAKNVYMTNNTRLCRGLTNCATIDLSGIDTSLVTNMDNLFYGDSSVTLLNLSTFDTSNVTSMANMFYGCSKLAAVDLSSFDTSKVTSMTSMFCNCSGLASIDVSHFDTSKVTSMASMFYGCSKLSDIDVSNFDTSNVISMSEMFRSCSSLKSLDLSNFDTSKVTTMTGMFIYCSKLVSVNVSSFDTSVVTGMANMFNGCSALTSLDVTNFNTENVTTMTSMFNACSKLTNLDVSNFDTGNVTTMYYMFNGCSGLTSLDVSNFNTSNVTNMQSMFCSCSKIENLDLSNFDTTNVINMSSMFSGCSKLETLGVSSFNTGNVTTMYYMFSGCLGLTGIDVSNFNTGNVINMQYMFNGCSSLTSLDVSSFNTANVTTMANMFYGCKSLTTLDVRNFNTTNVINMSNMFGGCEKLTSLMLDAARFNTANVTNMGGMFSSCKLLSSIDVSRFDTSNVTSMVNMFSSCINLTTLDVTGFDTGNVTTMSGMFSACNHLEELDVSGFNTANVTTMASMFSGCTNLEELDVSGFDTENVTTMASMFSGCTNLTDLDVGHFNTANVTNMTSMFNGCSHLTNLDVSHFNTENVTTMASMFCNCLVLPSLDVSNFNTKNVTSMTSMFQSCQVLTVLDVSGFNTENVTTMASMFFDCQNLTNPDVSGFDTTLVTTMENMFIGCKSLTSLDMSSFNTSLVANTKQMFQNCNNLESIYVSALWNMSGVTASTNMFNNCTKLRGGEGTPYNSSFKDKTYARIDNPAIEEEGYLTFRYHEVTGSLDEAYFNGKSLVTVTAVDNIKGFRRFDGTDEEAQAIIDNGSVVRFDNGSTDKKIYVWNTNGIINWWSDAENVYLKQNANLVFRSLTKCESINLTGINTSKVTDMSYMFYNCTVLTTLELGDDFDTSNVISMERMFYNCNTLAQLDLEGFDTRNVLNMSCMFRTDRSSGNSFTKLDLSSFHTEKVTNMEGMFYNCKKLQTLTLGENFNTSNVRTMSTMFYACSALKNFTLPDVFLTPNVTNMVSMFHGCSALETLDVSHFDTSKVTSMANMFNGCSKMRALDVSGFDTSNVRDMTYLFNGCANVGALDVSGFNTSNVRNMSFMFCGCNKVAALDVSGFDTGNVTNMASMFYGCKSVTSLAVHVFNTENVTDMSSMFRDCFVLNSLDVGGFVTNQVTSMAYMFSACGKLVELNVSNFDTANVVNMAYMFNGCSNITTLDVSHFDTTNVTIMDHMFCSCGKVGELDVSNFHTEKVTNMTYMFNGCATVTELDVSHFDTKNVTNMAYMFNGCKVTELDVSLFNTENVTTMANMFSGCSNIEELDVSHFDTKNVTNMTYMFNGCAKVAELDVSHFDTKNVTNMAYMFNGCNSVEALDVSHFNTEKVTNMTCMFSGCSKVAELNVSGFDTKNVINMASMFYNCLNVEDLDVSHFDTSKVTTMASMFYGCQKVEVLDVSQFDTSKVTSMVSMFQNCKALQSLDLSSFNTSGIRSLASMFNGCNALISVDLKSFNTFKVTDLSNTFLDCISLTNLDLSNFYTAKVTNMYRMFRNCQSLETLDLSNFNTANVTNMSEMFTNCKELMTIYASEDNWSTNKASSSGGMFSGDTKLVGGNNTTYNASKLDKSYAVAVGPEDTTPGYLTKKAATVNNRATIDSDTSPCNIVKVTDYIWTYTFTDLNPNLTYYAWEDENVETMGDGYEASNLEYSPLTVEALQGTITNKVIVNAPPVVETGSLSIAKQLHAEEGALLTDADLERSFVFTVTLTDENDEALSGTALYGSIPFSNGVATVRMPGGVTTTLSYIPEGYHYTITEDEITTFQQACINPSGDVETDPVSSQPVAKGVIVKDTTAAVTYTNTKSAIEEKFNSVTLKKEVTGKFEIGGEYAFTIALTGLHPSENYALSDGTTFDSNAKGMATIDLTLAKDEEITIPNLPVGSSYRITEAGGDYLSSFVITDRNDGDTIVQRTGGNTAKNTSLSTATEYVDEDEAITVTFTNEKNVRQNVTLKKLTQNATATNEDSFTFTVNLAGLENNSLLYTSLGPKQVSNDGKLSFEFTMNGGDEIIFYQLPVGATYQFTEAKNEWVSSYYLRDTNNSGQFVSDSGENTEADQELATAVETVNEGEEVTVVYTNTKVKHDVTLSKMVDMSEGGLSYAEYSSKQFKFTVRFTDLIANETYTMQYLSKVYSGILKTESFVANDDGSAELTIDLAHRQSVKFKSLPEGAGYTILEAPTIDYISGYTITGNDGAIIAKESEQNKQTYMPVETSQETVDPDELDVEVVFTNRYHYDPDARIYTIHIEKEIDTKLSVFGSPTFLFHLVNTDTGAEFTRAINISDSNVFSGSVTIKVPGGHYTVEEITVGRYTPDYSEYLIGTNASELQIDGNHVAIGQEEEGGKTFHFNLIAVDGVPGEAYLKYKNNLTNYNGLSHNDYRLNQVTN